MSQRNPLVIVGELRCYNFMVNTTEQIQHVIIKQQKHRVMDRGRQKGYEEGELGKVGLMNVKWCDGNKYEQCPS
jgi:hypothetical protein